MSKTITSLTCHTEYAHHQTFTVGQNLLNKIEEHQAQGEGDKWYYELFYEDGTTVKIFEFISSQSKL